MHLSCGSCAPDREHKYPLFCRASSCSIKVKVESGQMIDHFEIVRGGWSNQCEV